MIDEAGKEADLDFQIGIPLVWPQKTVLFQADDEWYQQDMLTSTTVWTGFFNSKGHLLLTHAEWL